LDHFIVELKFATALPTRRGWQQLFFIPLNRLSENSSLPAVIPTHQDDGKTRIKLADEGVCQLSGGLFQQTLINHITNYPN